MAELMKKNENTQYDDECEYIAAHDVYVGAALSGMRTECRVGDYAGFQLAADHKGIGSKLQAL
jgi:hypothetical protein